MKSEKRYSNTYSIFRCSSAALAIIFVICQTVTFITGQLNDTSCKFDIIAILSSQLPQHCVNASIVIIRQYLTVI